MNNFYQDKYIKYKNKYELLKKLLIGGYGEDADILAKDLDKDRDIDKDKDDAQLNHIYNLPEDMNVEFTEIDIDHIYNNLLYNGFYHNINIISDDPTKSIKDDSITIPKSCNNRESNIVMYKMLGSFILLKSPCRIGRSSHYCSKKYCFKNCSIIDNDNTCPICNIIDLNVISPCAPLNKIIRLRIQCEYPLIIIPNAYPYLEKHFLIVSPSHSNQIDSLKNEIIIYNLFTIFNTILKIGKGVVFFNGMCGNSLEHFHCQYTTTKMPLFEEMDETYEGIYNNNELRGYSIIISDNIDLFITCTQIIIDNDLTYNFIVRKVNKGLQIVLFIRYCKVPNGIKDLNFGSTELSGIIVSNEELSIDLNDIRNYINETNRLIDYDFFETKLMNLFKNNINDNYINDNFIIKQFMKNNFDMINNNKNIINL